MTAEADNLGTNEPSSRKVPPKTARGWVLFAAPVLAVTLLVGLSALVVIAITLGQKSSTLALRQLMRGLLQRYDVQMGTTIVVYLAVLLAIWLLLPKAGPASLGSYFGRISWRSLALSLFSGFVFALMTGSMLAYLSEHKVVTFHTTAGERALLPHSLSQLELGLLAIAIVGPLVEEVYFRGLLLRWLRLKMPLALAAIPNAAVFAAIHFRFSTHVGPEGWVLTGGLFVFGLFATAWAGMLRSIWPAFAAHGMYNATLISAPVLVDLLR